MTIEHFKFKMKDFQKKEKKKNWYEKFYDLIFKNFKCTMIICLLINIAIIALLIFTDPDYTILKNWRLILFFKLIKQ